LFGPGRRRRSRGCPNRNGSNKTRRAEPQASSKATPINLGSGPSGHRRSRFLLCQPRGEAVSSVSSSLTSRQGGMGTPSRLVGSAVCSTGTGTVLVGKIRTRLVDSGALRRLRKPPGKRLRRRPYAGVARGKGVGSCAAIWAPRGDDSADHSGLNSIGRETTGRAAPRRLPPSRTTRIARVADEQKTGASKKKRSDRGGGTAAFLPAVASGHVRLHKRGVQGQEMEKTPPKKAAAFVRRGSR